jgi:acyl-coenzyme A thioesterase PaaI-like protein
MDGADSVKMSAAEIESYLDDVFPQIHFGGRSYTIDSVATRASVMRLQAGERHLRSGGTISGPSMMELADLAMYVAILATIGKVPLAVTTSLNINFLRKPSPGPLLGACTLLKLGVSRSVRSRSVRQAPPIWRHM